MRIRWQAQALQDIESIYKYVSSDKPIASANVVATIVRLVETQLPDSPNSGRIGRVAKTRELVISRTPYIVVYRLQGETIDILAVHHSARKWPERS